MTNLNQELYLSLMSFTLGFIPFSQSIFRFYPPMRLPGAKFGITYELSVVIYKVFFLCRSVPSNSYQPSFLSLTAFLFASSP